MKNPWLEGTTEGETIHPLPRKVSISRLAALAHKIWPGSRIVESRVRVRVEREVEPGCSEELLAIWAPQPFSGIAAEAALVSLLESRKAVGWKDGDSAK